MIKGTGIDIIEIDRIRKAVERWGDAFLNHVFTQIEIENARKYKCPYPHYAGRFAAKEAIFKAAGIPNLSWHSVSIVNDRDGKPVLQYHHPALSSAVKDRLLISISHGRDYAVASAIVEG